MLPLFNPTEFPIHFKKLLLEIQESIGKSLDEVYQIVSATMYKILLPAWGRNQAASLGEASLRAYASKKRPSPMDQQKLEAFVLAYLYLINKINYETVISLYAANGLGVNKAYIDVMAQKVKAINSKDSDGNFNDNVWKREYPTVEGSEADPEVLLRLLKSSIERRSYRYLRSYSLSYGLSVEQIIEASKYDLNNSVIVGNSPLFLRWSKELPLTIANLKLQNNISSQENFRTKIISFSPSLASFAFHALSYIISSQFDENIMVVPIHDFLLYDLGILASANPFFFDAIIDRWTLYTFPDLPETNARGLASEIKYRLLDGRAVALLHLRETSMDDDSLFITPKQIVCMTRGNLT